MRPSLDGQDAFGRRPCQCVRDAVLREISSNALLNWFLDRSTQSLSTGSAEEPKLLTDSTREANTGLLFVLIIRSGTFSNKSLVVFSFDSIITTKARRLEFSFSYPSPYRINMHFQFLRDLFNS